MRFARPGIVWRVAAPSLALSAVLLATVAIAALALDRVQQDSNRALDQAVSTADAAAELDRVVEEFRKHLDEYARTGDQATMRAALGLGDETLTQFRQL